MLNFKKNKVVILIFLFSLSPIILNLFFFITDIIAGKEVKYGEILYSSISNEKWLDFWGTFMPALAAFSFLYFTKKQTESMKKQLDFEKKRYENEIENEKIKYKKEKKIEAFEKNIILELNELKKTKKIIYNFLTELDIPDIGFSIMNDNNYGKKIKRINTQLTAVDILTPIRIGDINKEINKKDEQLVRMEECKKNGYDMLVMLHKLYCAILKMSLDERKNRTRDNKEVLINLNNIKKFKNDKFYELTNLTDENIREDYNNFYNETLDVLLEYFYLREDKIKYERKLIYNKEEK